MKSLCFTNNVRRAVLGLAMATAGMVAFGQVQPPELPDAEQARSAIEQDPSVVQARSALEAAGHGAAMLATGPYEWSVGGTAQRRRTDGERNSNEWNVQLSRPIRIGGKAELDRKLGRSSEDLARAQLAVARDTAAHTLVDTWLDWLAARQTRMALDDQIRIAEQNQRTVDLRLKAGDASRLDQNVAQGDLAAARRQAVEAATAEAKALAALQLRYPMLALQPRPLPEPSLQDMSEAQWRDRVVSGHPGLAAASEALRRAELAAERAQAERTPDPTVGVFVASEARRSERIVGVSFSIPLGGNYRQQAALEALRQVDVARAGLEGERRALELEVTGQVREALGSIERWKLAEQAARALQDTAQLSQKAYAAGELEIQALLLVRRQALEAASAAQAARADALRVRYRLLLDTGELWPQVP